MSISNNILEIALRSVVSHTAAGRDGKGYSNADAAFAQRMCSKPIEEWTDEEQIQAYRLLRKYQRQLRSIGIAYDGIQPPIGYRPEWDLPQREIAESIGELGYVVLEEAEAKRAKRVISRVTPKWGEKRSPTHNRWYADDPIPSLVKEVQAQLSEGKEIINHLHHGEPIYDAHKKFIGWDYTNCPEISVINDVWLSEAGELFIDESFTYATPESIAYAEAAARKENLFRSWEVSADCTGANGTGLCWANKFYSVAWLQPGVEQPGFGSTARVVELVEGARAPCPCKGQCDDCKGEHKSHPLIESTENSNSNAGLPSSGPTTPKGAISMSTQKPLKEAEGGGGMMISISVEDWLKSQAGKSWAEIEPMIPGDLNPGDVSLMWAKMQGAGSAPPEPGMEGKPPTYEATEAAKKAAAVKAAEEKAAADLKASQLAEAEKDTAYRTYRDKQLAEFQSAEKRQSLINQIYAETSKEAFGSHALKEQSLYPVGKVQAIVKSCIALVEKVADSTDVHADKIENWDQARIFLNSEFRNLATRSKELAEAEAKTALRGSLNAGSFEVGENKEIDGVLEKMYQQADEAALRTPQGRERLRIRDGIKEEVAKKFGGMMNYHRVKHARLLAEAMKFRNGASNAAELREAAIESDFIPLHESTLTASNLANQATYSNVIFRRSFEEDESNRIMGELVNDARFGSENDPLNEFGREIRWATHYLIEPDSDNDGVIDDSATANLTSVDIERGYDSAFSDEMGYEYLWKKKDLRNLENGPFKERIYAEMVDSLGGLFGRRLGKAKWTEIDNACRYDGFHSRLDNGTTVFEDEDEDGANAEMVTGNEITFTNTVKGVAVNYTVTYGSNVGFIYRLLMGQSTGGTIEPRLIIRNYADRFLLRSGATSTNNYNVVSGTENDGTTALIFGDIDPITRQIVDKFSGQGATCAIDYENCVLLIKDGETDIDATSPPKNLRYSWVETVEAGGNLTIFSLTVPDTTTPEAHYNELLQNIIFKASFTQDTEFVTPRVAISSATIMKGLVSAAQRWQAQFGYVGSNLKPNFQDVNNVGSVGLVDLFGTNGKLPGKSGVIVITDYGYSKWAITEAMSTDGIRPLDTTGSAENVAVKSTTSARQSWTLQRAIKTPRVFDKTTGVPYNRVGSLIKLVGSASFS